MKTYNRSEIMKAAWNLYKENTRYGNQYYTQDENGNLILHTITFGDMLKEAWTEAEAAVTAAKKTELAANDTRFIEVSNKLFDLEMKDRWSNKDYELDSQLRAKREMLINEIQAAA